MTYQNSETLGSRKYLRALADDVGNQMSRWNGRHQIGTSCGKTTKKSCG